jgi:hypothetical protein
MPTKLSLIRRAFHALNRAQQNHLLSEVYGYSQEIRQFLESRLLNTVDGNVLTDAMQKETLGKVFHRPIPHTPDGRNVRRIIARAKKLGADDGTMMELERLAFEGFVEFLNEYGGGPESFDEMACDHLEVYLRLIKMIVVDQEQYKERIDGVRRYIQKKHNMITDYIYDVFEKETGTPV